MPENKKLKYAECTRRRKSCVEIFWETIERLEQRAKNNLKANEKELWE